MKFRPLNDYVLVKRQDREKVSKGGILIPDTNQVKSRFAEVLAVGPGRHLKTNDRRPVDLVPGQVVFFKGTAGHEIDINDETGYVLLKEDEIDGILDEV